MTSLLDEPPGMLMGYAAMGADAVLQRRAAQTRGKGGQRRVSGVRWRGGDGRRGWMG